MEVTVTLRLNNANPIKWVCVVPSFSDFLARFAKVIVRDDYRDASITVNGRYIGQF